MNELLRKELKYSVSTVDFYRLRPVLEAVLEPDAHDPGSRGYEVRSLYFDSAWDGDLLDVLEGLLSKQKLRLRCYGAEAETLKLEYKCKTGTDSRKSSLTVSRRDAYRMLSGSYDFLTELPEPLAAELYGRLMAGAYRPKAVVAYKRVAFQSPVCDTRVTFDFDAVASADPEAFFDRVMAAQPISAPGSGVLELKYSGFLPEYIRGALRGLEKSPVGNSKYAIARLSL